jgi:protein subunit release factor B
MEEREVCEREQKTFRNEQRESETKTFSKEALELLDGNEKGLKSYRALTKRSRAFLLSFAVQ